MVESTWMEKVKYYNDEVSQLKREFRSYNTYVNRCTKYKKELDALQHELEHLKSPVLDKPVIRTENTNHERYFKIIDELKPELENRLYDNQNKLFEIIRKMNNVTGEDRDIIDDIFVNKLTIEKAAKKYNYETSGMEYKLDSILLKIVKKLGY